MGSTELDATRKAFNENLQDLIIQQASRIINNDLIYQVAAFLPAGSAHIHR